MNLSVTLISIISAACVILIAFGLAVAMAWRFSKRQPFKTFVNLKTRQKVRFLKALITDHRVPWVAKLVPVLLLGYLAMPFDIIPDFLPVLGYLDDVIIVILALVLFIRLCRVEIVKELLEEFSEDSDVSEVLSSR